MLLGDLAGGIEPADAGDSIDQLEQLELVDGGPAAEQFFERRADARRLLAGEDQRERGLALA